MAVMAELYNCENKIVPINMICAATAFIYEYKYRAGQGFKL